MMALPIGVSASSFAQILPLNSTDELTQPNSGQITVGGTPSMDLVRLTAGMNGATLRYGNVIKNSELVLLNGVRLQPGKDYSFDYKVGVVFVSRSYREGDSLTVQYRYDSKAPVESGSAASGLPPMKFDFLGGLSMRMGFGQTERSADGKVLRSNIWGTKNNFSATGMGLSGAYFAGNREQQNTVDGMTFDTQAKGGNAAGDTGKSSFLVQKFNMALGGGAQLIADVQNVSSNFTGFNQVKDAGYTDEQVNAFVREKGLKRQGMGIEGLNLGGGMKFSGGNKSVMDGDKGIRTSAYSLNNGAFSYARNTEQIERGFNRFKDLGVGDWQRLAQSQAIQNSTETAGLKSAFGALSFSRTSIKDLETEAAISKSILGFSNTKIDVSFSNQSVSNNFNRFEAERGVFGLEAGLRRQDINLTKGIIGKDLNMTFARSSIKADQNGFASSAMELKGKTWSVTSNTMAADSGFGRLGSMAPQEMDAYIKRAGDMYGPGMNAGAQERGNFMRSNGLDRQNTAINMQPNATTAIRANHFTAKGANGKASLDTVDVSTKNLKFNLRKLGLADSFTEVTNLMQFEQRQLGMVAGLGRTDVGLNMNLGKKGVLDFNMMSAQHGDGKADRTRMSYTGQGIEASYNQRKVGAGFGVAGQLEDQEKGYLAWLTGFQQTDSRLKFAPLKNMQFEYAQNSAYNELTTELRDQAMMALSLNLDKDTNFGYLKQDSLNKTSNSTILAASLERLSLNRKFGNSAFSVTKETQDFKGQSATPNVDKTSMALETKLSQSTSVRTENTETKYSSGEKENVQSNTISTKILKNVGVSVTDTNINRTGDNRDETKRDYGFWVDFGKGVRMTYGYARHLNGEAAGFGSTGFAFGQDASRINPNQAVNGVGGANVNGTMFSFANGSNSWDDQIGRTQAFSSASLSTQKPFHLAFLDACKLNVQTNMASDNTHWLREDVAGSFEGKMGKYGLGVQYKGQVNQQGQRAIDRTYRFKTDFSDKSPLSASFTYKQRIMPDNKEYAIRDYQVNWKVGKGWTLSNTIQTNPEGPYNPNIVLGTQPMGQRRNIWRADYAGNKNFSFGGQFDELRDDTLASIRRTAGINMSFFQGSGSPLNMFYGIEQNDQAGARNSYVRFGLSFDQKPSTNQIFSLSVSNQGWLQNANTSLTGTNDWVARLNYQWRFK